MTASACDGSHVLVQGQLLSNVQILRFFAATSVLISHAADLFLRNTSPFLALPWTGGVDIFFVISGFVMTWLVRDDRGGVGAARRFLLRRAIRIVPAYWFFTTLLIVTVLVAPVVRHTEVNPPAIATSYAFIPWPRGDGQLKPILSQGWTLNYEAFFYVAFAATFLFRRGLVVIAACFGILAFANSFVPTEALLVGFYTSPIILEFVGGIALARLYIRGTRLPLWGAALCIAAAVACFFLLRPLHLGSFDRALSWGLPALLLAAALVLSPEPRRQGVGRRWLQQGGDASYTIYLSHTFTINAIAVLWHTVGIGLSGLGLILAVAATIASSVLFYRLIEGPFTVWLQRKLVGRPMPVGQTVAP